MASLIKTCARSSAPIPSSGTPTSRSRTASSIAVGPSGCGKSTTLRMIAGPWKVRRRQRDAIGGRQVNAPHPADRDVAMVFQSYALYPHMSVRENISTG